MNTTTLATTTSTSTHLATELTRRVAHLKAQAAHLNTGDIDASDHRLITLWSQTGELADEHNMCSMYDSIVREHGGITRERDYTVGIDVTITATISITHTVTAQNEDDAQNIAREETDISVIEDHITDIYNVDFPYEIDSWEPYEAEEA
ncbi:hypothetical protein [Agrococcus casei]|uniref:Uncharacterized protein n=1 Tax=Agrococcus casei LMG 22410 TaxID=1255656 RepID=A0A1R4FIU3_9MICO|nr:hypothetical protein [Agrococcus casei]SJM55682.1 hypothetical protein CZ674_04660 [Agrococcus casei LMG 22410]